MLLKCLILSRLFTEDKRYNSDWSANMLPDSVSVYNFIFRPRGDFQAILVYKSQRTSLLRWKAKNNGVILLSHTMLLSSFAQRMARMEID